MSLFDNLPPELVAEILSYLSYEERERLRQASRGTLVVVDAAPPGSYVTRAQALAWRQPMPEEASGLASESAGIRGGIQHAGSMTTARSLLLDRFLRLPTYDRHWGSDNYMTMLGLTPQDLQSMRGRRVLDVGSGLGVFGSEVAVLYGIQVDRVDLNAGAFRRVDYEAVASAYAEGVAVLEYAREKFPAAMTMLVGPHVDEVLPAVKANLSKIVRHYLVSMTSVPIVNDSVADMRRSQSDQYDAVVSLVLFMYLPEEVQAQGLKELVRVTRIGGEIRILPGNTLGRRHPMSKKFVMDKARFDNKAVEVQRFEYEGLMVLRVVECSRCLLM